MPLIEVEVVADHELSPTLAPRLAEAAGQALVAPAGQTWVRLRRLATTSYAESGGAPPAGVRPVFVQVLQARLPDEAALSTGGRPERGDRRGLRPPRRSGARGALATRGGPRCLRRPAPARRWAVTLA